MSEQPVWKCTYGRVKCAIFQKQVERKDGATFTAYSCVIARNYKDKDGVWHSTSSFETKDLHDLIFCATKAYDEIRSRPHDT